MELNGSEAELYKSIMILYGEVNPTILLKEKYKNRYNIFFYKTNLLLVYLLKRNFGKAGMLFRYSAKAYTAVPYSSIFCNLVKEKDSVIQTALNV